MCVCVCLFVVRAYVCVCFQDLLPNHLLGCEQLKINDYMDKNTKIT